MRKTTYGVLAKIHECVVLSFADSSFGGLGAEEKTQSLKHSFKD